jgi:hypothetical protein
MKQIGASLAKGEVTQEVTCQGNWAVISVSGTLDGETLTVEVSPNGGANWFTYRSDDVAGTAASATIVAADVSTGLFSQLFVAGDQRLRLSFSNGAGSPTSVNVWAGGRGVDVDEKSVQG